MAKLSQKQVQRLEDKWNLEGQARVIKQEIADLIAEPTARLEAVRAAWLEAAGLRPTAASVVPAEDKQQAE